MRITNLWLVSFLLLLFPINNILAQSFETLDQNFGEEGKLFIDINGASELFETAQFQPDGKLLLVGGLIYEVFSKETDNSSDFLITRVTTDGKLDEDFGDGGIVVTSFGYQREQFYSMLLMSDGKLLVAGYISTVDSLGRRTSETILARYLDNGNLDISFGVNGLLILEIEDLTINSRLVGLADDKFLLTACKNCNWNDASNTRRLSLIQFNLDGSLDTKFGVDGQAEYSKEDLNIEYISELVAHKEQLYLAGPQIIDGIEEFAIARFHLDGQLDTLFGIGGLATTSFGFSGGAFPNRIAFQEDDKIIVTGSAVNAIKSDFALARFGENGSIDESFGEAGKVTTELTDFSSLAIQTDDHPIDIFLQPDGKILVVGSSRSGSFENRTAAITKYEENGSLDFDFGNRGKLMFPDFRNEEYVPLIFLEQSDASMIFAGRIDDENNKNDLTDFQLIRFLTDLNVGTLDLLAYNSTAFVYPNPIEDLVTLEYSLKTPETLTIQLTDIHGRIIKTYLQMDFQKAGNYQQEIDLPENLAKGIYFVRLSSANGQLVVKVTK